jgi:hypothetical protein
MNEINADTRNVVGYPSRHCSEVSRCSERVLVLRLQRRSHATANQNIDEGVANSSRKR